MDYRRENRLSSGDVVHVLSGSSRNPVNESWESGLVDQAVWATEDEYGMWIGEASFDTNSNSSYDGARAGSEPPSKRSRGSNTGDGAASNRSKAIGKMFYKTKLCCKFRAGTCPYITNCNFAHSVEELRKPPDNWQEIVAAHEEERASSSEPREEFQIPIVGVSDETQRSYKGRHCKKFYTEEGCPYGESCTFLHDEQSKARESVAISLGPGSGNGNGNGSGSGNCNTNGNGGGSGYGGSVSGPTLKPSNWKTRICNKWELTGYCPFGSKCHFAHGAAELHNYSGGPTDLEAKNPSTPDAKQPVRTPADSFVAALPHGEGYHMGIRPQRLSSAIQRSGQRPNQKWKGPDKISKIYGDWIDDL